MLLIYFQYNAYIITYIYTFFLLIYIKNHSSPDCRPFFLSDNLEYHNQPYQSILLSFATTDIKANTSTSTSKKNQLPILLLTPTQTTCHRRPRPSEKHNTFRSQLQYNPDTYIYRHQKSQTTKPDTISNSGKSNTIGKFPHRNK